MLIIKLCVKLTNRKLLEFSLCGIHPFFLDTTNVFVWLIGKLMSEKDWETRIYSAGNASM